MEKNEKQEGIAVEEGIFPYTEKEAKEKGIKKSSDLNKKVYFPSKMKELRNRYGYTQQEVANIIGVTKSTIGLYETGDNIPDIKNLYKIAKLYRVSADYLLKLSEAESPDIDIQAINAKTGLSEKAILTLTNTHTLEKTTDINGVQIEKVVNTKAPKALSKIIEHKEFGELMRDIKGLQEFDNSNDAKIRNMIDFHRRNEAHEILIFLIQKAFVKIIEDISPFEPDTEPHTRKATQHNYDCF